MKYRLLVFLGAIVALSGARAAPVALFDGKTLDGWEGDPKPMRLSLFLFAFLAASTRSPRSRSAIYSPI